MSKKTKGRITAFWILFSILIIFLFSLFIDYWLAETSLGKFFGRSLRRLSFFISLITFFVLYIFIDFIIIRPTVRRIKKKRKNRKK